MCMCMSCSCSAYSTVLPLVLWRLLGIWLCPPLWPKRLPLEHGEHVHSVAAYEFPYRRTTELRTQLAFYNQCRTRTKKSQRFHHSLEYSIVKRTTEFSGMVGGLFKILQPPLNVSRAHCRVRFGPLPRTTWKGTTPLNQGEHITNPRRGHCLSCRLTSCLPTVSACRHLPLAQPSALLLPLVFAE